MGYYVKCGDEELKRISARAKMPGQTDWGGFEDVKRLHSMICRVKDRDDFPVLLVGNKADLENERHVTRSEAEELARSLNVPYVECSAKLRMNVDQAFHGVVRLVRFNTRKTSEFGLKYFSELESLEPSTTGMSL
uniref:Ras domain containing protein n=1 Tax=Haemonchus contortus TaxID=6289 RepID=W6NQY6_HAECO